MATPKKMKAAIDANRRAAGEPPRPKDPGLVPKLKKAVPKLAALKDDLDSVPAHVAPGPEKPSVAAEAVAEVIRSAVETSPFIGETLTVQGAYHVAAAIVRRFPGLTQKPKSKHRRCCGTLAGSAPHEPGCSEHPDNLAAKRAAARD